LRGGPPLLREPEPLLPQAAEGEAAVGEYLSTGMTLRSHPMALLRPQLDEMGFAGTRRVTAGRPCVNAA
jgi:error-prone DNA polymerase